MDEEQNTKSPVLRKIRVRNMLSFGPNGIELDFPALTVLVGPNGSGKTNLLETMGLLKAAPKEVAAPVREGGGIRHWVWKRQTHLPATVEAIIENPRGNQSLRHSIEFTESEQTFKVVDELVENEHPYPGHDDSYFFYRFQRGHPVMAIRGENNRRHLRPDAVTSDESILSQRKDPDQFPELAYLSGLYDSFRFYREWAFGRKTIFRQPHSIDVRPSPLMEDFTNLGMFLSRLRQDPKTKASMIEKLSDAYAGLTDFELNFEGGTVQVFFTEGELAVPASRLSDGSLRYLCLLAILLDPDPPPLVGIEEPEMGVHPDLVPKLADLLVDASRRCQLVVTTHSDILVDALSERPESVVVCEKHDGQTSMKRLDSSDLIHWLEKYRLGELWTSGELGGVRW